MSLAAEFMDHWKADVEKYGQYSVHPHETAEDEDGLDLTMVHSEIVDRLRWANVMRDVFYDKTTDSYVEIVYESSNGQESYGADEMNVVAYDVVPQQVSKTVYQRI